MALRLTGLTGLLRSTTNSSSIIHLFGGLVRYAGRSQETQLVQLDREPTCNLKESQIDSSDSSLRFARGQASQVHALQLLVQLATLSPGSGSVGGWPRETLLAHDLKELLDFEKRKGAVELLPNELDQANGRGRTLSPSKTQSLNFYFSNGIEDKLLRDWRNDFLSKVHRYSQCACQPGCLMLTG